MKSANIEIGAVKRLVNLVQLEKCEKNDTLVAKFGFDTAEYDPSKVGSR